MRQKWLPNYCEPIPYESAGGNCTVEFADTPGGFLTNWRITTQSGEVRTGFCEEAGKKVFDAEPNAPFDDLTYAPQAADLHDCRAIKATWPRWEEMGQAS